MSARLLVNIAAEINAEHQQAFGKAREALEQLGCERSNAWLRILRAAA